jgi:hypothetical protein
LEGLIARLYHSRERLCHMRFFASRCAKATRDRSLRMTEGEGGCDT